MRRTLIARLATLCVAACLPGVNVAAFYDTPLASSISTQFVQKVCDGTEPRIVVNLSINAADVGRPGLVYVAMVNPGRDQFVYTVGSVAGWFPYEGEAMYPPFAVVRGGLHSTALTLPVGFMGWDLYVGYGALSAKGEQIVQAGQAAVAKAKQAGRPALGVDADHHRRALVQDDMERNGKYARVLTWEPKHYVECQFSG